MMASAVILFRWHDGGLEIVSFQGFLLLSLLMFFISFCIYILRGD